MSSSIVTSLSQPGSGVKALHHVVMVTAAVMAVTCAHISGEEALTALHTLHKAQATTASMEAVRWLGWAALMTAVSVTAWVSSRK